MTNHKQLIQELRIPFVTCARRKTHLPRSEKDMKDTAFFSQMEILGWKFGRGMGENKNARVFINMKIDTIAFSNYVLGYEQ